MDKYLVVLIGGGLGSVARLVVGTTIMTRYSGRFPFGTFVINVTGSFLIGLLMTLFTERLPEHVNWRLFFVTGILGGYTTFSSFEYESLVASKSDTPFIGLLYLVSSVGFGYLAVWVGTLLMTRR